MKFFILVVSVLLVVLCDSKLVSGFLTHTIVNSSASVDLQNTTDTDHNFYNVSTSTNMTNVHSRQKRAVGANVNFNINFDVAKMIEIQMKTTSRAGFVRGVLNEIRYNFPEANGFATMVFDLNQSHNYKIFDIQFYQTVTKDDWSYGVWIFRCGEFINKGTRGWEHWGYQSPCWHNFNGGDGVHFENNWCKDEKWRETYKC